MKINRLSMEGFRGATTPAVVSFDTSKAVTLIFGENGTGKSTIADAFDFICNGAYGSIETYSLGGAPKKFVTSLGTQASVLKVTASDATTSWVATLGTAGRVLTPPAGCPDCRILRRRTILKLIEAQPKERFQVLKDFLSLPNIEKAEAALRQAVKESNDALNESSRSLSQAQEALAKRWSEEGKPCKDPMAWATVEAGKDVTQLQVCNTDIDSIETAWIAADNAVAALAQATGNEAAEKKSVEEASARLAATSASQTAQSAELAKLLQEAQNYIEQVDPLTKCPVCENGIDRGLLLQRLAARLVSMNKLRTLLEVQAKAQKRLDSATAVRSNAEKSFLGKVQALGLLLKKSSLAEIAAQAIAWPEYEAFFSAVEPSSSAQGQARKLLSEAASCRVQLKHRRERDQKSITHHKELKGHADTIREMTELARKQEALRSKLEAVLAIFSSERKDYIDEILAKIAGAVEALYSRLHPGEGVGGVRFYLKPNVIGSLEFDATFLDSAELPPQAYYSESHLDTLGICVFLALTKLFKTNDTIVILDDVLTSADSSHLDRFMALIHDEAKNFNQVILTTHYRPWRDRYRWAKGPAASTQVIELGPWSLAGGLQPAEFYTALDELKALRAKGVADRQVLASKAGILLESLLDFITLKYRCKVRRSASNEYTLGDLEAGVDSTLAKELRCSRPDDNGGKQDAALKPLLAAATASPWIRNAVGCHFSQLGAEIADGEVKTFVDSTLGLADTMICADCKTLPTRRPSGSKWECKCGHLEMHPLVYPGADPGTVDDEG